MQSINETITNTLQNKLQNLVSFLYQITKGFDTVSEDIDNPDLKTAVAAVAAESGQYAKEINTQLQKHDIAIPMEHTDLQWKEIEVSVNKEAGLAKGSEIIALCNNCESYFSNLYNDVLQEYFPTKLLKEIIAYQLYAIKCAFMKIRLLNTLRFNQENN